MIVPAVKWDHPSEPFRGRSTKTWIRPRFPSESLPLSAAPTWLSAAAAWLLGTSFAQPAGVQPAEPGPLQRRSRRPRGGGARPLNRPPRPATPPRGGTPSRGVLTPPLQMWDIWERSLHPSPLTWTCPAHARVGRTPAGRRKTKEPRLLGQPHVQPWAREARGQGVRGPRRKSWRRYTRAAATQK